MASLCVSPAGAYRAMLFHLGAVWRLNEFGYLPKLDRVSSVSGRVNHRRYARVEVERSRV